MMGFVAYVDINSWPGQKGCTDAGDELMQIESGSILENASRKSSAGWPQKVSR